MFQRIRAFFYSHIADKGAKQTLCGKKVRGTGVPVGRAVCAKCVKAMLDDYNYLAKRNSHGSVSRWE